MYFIATLRPAMKYSVGIEVYRGQQISKEGPAMGVTARREGAGPAWVEKRSFSSSCGFLLPRPLTR